MGHRIDSLFSSLASESIPIHVASLWMPLEAREGQGLRRSDGRLAV